MCNPRTKTTIVAQLMGCQCIAVLWQPAFPTPLFVLEILPHKWTPPKSCISFLSGPCAPFWAFPFNSLTSHHHTVAKSHTFTLSGWWEVALCITSFTFAVMNFNGKQKQSQQYTVCSTHLLGRLAAERDSCERRDHILLGYHNVERQYTAPVHCSSSAHHSILTKQRIVKFCIGLNDAIILYIAANDFHIVTNNAISANHRFPDFTILAWTNRQIRHVRKAA